jgi:hypothetical protein
MTNQQPIYLNSNGDLNDFGSSDTISPQNGGTGADGSTATQGAIPIADGAGNFDFNTLTAGANITVDNSNPGQITINSTGGSSGFTSNSESSDFTAVFQNLYLVDASSSNVNCTLPDAATGSGQEIIVVCINNNFNTTNLAFITVGSGPQTINGLAASSFVPPDAGSNPNSGVGFTYYRFISDGSNYQMIQGTTQLDQALVSWSSTVRNNGGNNGLFFQGNGNTGFPAWGGMFNGSGVVSTNFDLYPQFFTYADISSSSLVFTLQPALAPNGAQIIVKVINAGGGNTLTFATTGSDTINGAAASALPALTAIGQTYVFTSNLISGIGDWSTTTSQLDLSLNVNGILGTAHGGTGASNLNALATSGANSNITSLTGLTTPLSTAHGGTGSGSSQSALQIFGGPNTPGGSAAAPTFKSYDATVLFGGASNARPAPTSGTLTGDYYTSANWTQTGALTLNRCKLYFGGNATFNAGVVIGQSIAAGPQTIQAFAPGSGIAPGAPTRNGITGAGNGGGHAGAGGSGGSGLAVSQGGGGGTYPFEATLMGSSGSPGAGDTSSVLGGAGGAGSDGVYIEVLGNFTTSGTITINGTGGNGGSPSATAAGSGGGGSGGTIDIRALGTATIGSGTTFTVAGGSGGNTGSGSNPGGGGGGGYISILCAGTLTDNGTYTVSGGAAGTGSNTGTAATAGSAGSSVRTGSTNVTPRRQF